MCWDDEYAPILLSKLDLLVSIKHLRYVKEFAFCAYRTCLKGIYSSHGQLVHLYNRSVGKLLQKMPGLTSSL
jgi:hypothetical protein